MINISNGVTIDTTNESTIVIKTGLFSRFSVSSKEFLREISKQTYTRNYVKYMFSKITNTEMTFDKFFLLEVSNILELLLNNKTYGINNRTVASALMLIKDNTWVGNVDIDYDNIPSRLNRKKLDMFKFTPLAHQEGFYDYYDKTVPNLKLSGTLLAAGAGTGKTYMALTMAEMLEMDFVIIVCPLPALNRVWISSITDGLYKDKQEYWTPNEGKDYNGERVVVVHYEALSKLVNISSKFKDRHTMVILDESHNLNEISANRTIMFMEFVKNIRSDNVLLLSGTPIKAMGVEVIPLLTAVDKSFKKTTMKRFKKVYRTSSYRAKEIIKRRLGYASFKVEKSEVKLPPVEIKNISFKLKKPEPFLLDTIRHDMQIYLQERIKFYNENYDTFVADYENGLHTYEINMEGKKEKDLLKKYKQTVKIVQKNYKTNTLSNIPDELKFCSTFEKKLVGALLDSTTRKRFLNSTSVIKYLRLKLQGEVLGNIVGKRRIEAFTALSGAIDYDMVLNTTVNKTVIFSNYIKVCENITKILKDKGHDPLGVYGSDTKYLTSTVDKFMTSENHQELVATYKSLSTAVPLIVADTMLLVDMPFRSYIYEQAISRLHRLGQKNKVLILIASLDTGDELNIVNRSIDIMKWSQQEVEDLTGVISTYKEEEIAEEISVEEFKWDTSRIDSLESYNLMENTKPKAKYLDW